MYVRLVVNLRIINLDLIIYYCCRQKQENYTNVGKSKSTLENLSVGLRSVRRFPYVKGAVSTGTSGCSSRI